MRHCGTCTACCDGNLAATIFSHKMYPGKPCNFLKNKKCSVYSVRPTTCRKYFCGWAQELVSEKYRPDLCGYLVTVKKDNQKQYLEVLQISENVDNTIFEEINNFVKKENSEYILIEKI